MTSSITRDRWVAVLEAADPPTFGTIVEQLATNHDFSEADATQAIDAALEDGLLDEQDTDGAFPHLTLASTPGGRSGEQRDVYDPESVAARETSAAHSDAETTTFSTAAAPTVSAPGENPGAADENPGGDGEKPTSGAGFDPAAFTDPDERTWPTNWAEDDRWMCRIPEQKHSFAPWGDRDHPAGEAGKDARYKWGLRDNHADLETALEWDDRHPRTGGVAFHLIEQDEDPWAFVDGDDVRCPETGEVHPEFLEILEKLGRTYADISTSGSGVHAAYAGDLPPGGKTAEWQLDDEPWGENDAGDLPTVEIYDHTHVCIATGDHVPGTSLEARPWDDEALAELLEEHDQLPDRPEPPDREEIDLEEHDPTATEADETTDDIRDVFAALGRLDARRVAGETIVQRWNDHASTSDGKRAFWPTWGSTSDGGTANVVDDRIWQDTGDRGGYGGPAVMAAIDLGRLSDRQAEGAVRGGLWWDAIDHLRELGFSIPRYVETTTATPSDADNEALTERDVTLDPAVAWRAAGAVDPEDLDTQPDLEATDAGTGWSCPGCGEEVDVVRAAAIDVGIVTDCQTALSGDAYDRAYNHARRGLDAPLPEYVSQQTATERWDLVQGALREFTFWHLVEDALNSTITGRGDDVDGAAELTIDPAWRESNSGSSVLVFPSGAVYDAHPDHEAAIGPLRFVALDAGLLEWTEFTHEENLLTGDTFRDAYDTARDYGAPLPRWEGSDAYHTAILPDAEALDDDADLGDDARLQAAYDAVGDLYREAATSDEATLMRALPGLGKTGQVFRNADEHPALYTAGRKELMADAVDRCTEHGVTAYVLPVFAENGLPTDVQAAADAVVREQGQRLLRDRWDLLAGVEDRLPDDQALPDPDEDGEEDAEAVALERESCPTANGDYGLAWWLAVHAARARGYRPQQIHENAPALFGDDLPCTCNDDHPDGEATCPYTDGWDTATDPEAPIDVLVGHYTHAHVEGARTHTERRNGRLQTTPRVVALDEFPGSVYQREFGDEYPDHAAWLAGCLRDDITDRHDVLTHTDDLWTDDTVRAWLDPDDTAPPHDRLTDTLQVARAGVEAVETATWLLEYRRDACSALDVELALEALIDAHPEFPPDAVETVIGTLSAVLTDEETREYGDTTTIRALDELLADLQAVHRTDTSVATALDGLLDDTTAVGGALESLVADAVEVYRHSEDGARGLLAAAEKGLKGGAVGCETVAMHAADGYAHPLAHALLYGLLAPADSEQVETLRADSFTFDREDGTRLSSVEYGETRVVVDRNHHGAVVNDPPAFTADGAPTPTVGLDATGRPRLWELVLGRDVTARDIHDSMADRRRFLRETNGLQVVQTSPHANSYEGDPTGKNFDDDLELLAEISREYRDAFGQQPAALTTKVVEDTLDGRLEDLAAATDHYGNLKGSNALAGNRLAALLGCQHYGDHVVERWGALAGEEANRTGHGMALDYNSPVANTALQHMREDQVMQAALRFGRDTGGALVFAHTAALRPDLPVVAEGEVVRTFSEQAQAIAEAAAGFAHRSSFTARDVLERVDGHDPTPRSVRRTLGELAEFGYLDKDETPNGHANRFAIEDDPGVAEIDLPDVESRAADPAPGRDPLEVVYTWAVRVTPGKPRSAGHRTAERTQLPAPDGGGSGGAASVPPG